MPETTQLKFGLREVAIELLKHSKIDDGKWAIGVEFGFGASNIGPSEEEAKPTGLVVVNSFLLTRQPDDAPDTKLLIDASKL